ncbi:sugar-binding transcriptional regulator [Bogoriella caseilytica]|uniref:DNA-binding transcriptional regulator LsrR (DeoR family) n=1 Tax=Bogoriella caseilytica TaxID=56055 RepID=A0A3N2BB58_9MICO|nr:sugar-binding domain-containing protein [Bogoriella caseilytica]ROR72412.1 DNA-binding transcriptional regulator LsrR (DeoR family) [Bogoriella caseilytica]
MTEDAPARLSTSQLRQLTRVARLYHERGVRQAEIAASLGVSQAKVSRMLRRAAQMGVVRTTVMIAPGLHTDVEEHLEQAYGLSEAVVVDVEPGAGAKETIEAIGAGAAAYLETALNGAEHRIGISSWSRTLLATVERMRPVGMRPSSEVIQLLGGVGAPRAQSQAHRLLEDFARVLGAEPVHLHAPGMVQDAQVRRRLMGDPALSEVAERWRRLTVAVVGIGTIEPSALLAESGNAFASEDREALLAEGAAGDICHRVFRADGSPISGSVDQRTISIPSTEFRAIPQRIGIAGGEDKVAPVHGALAGGWVNTLITDLHTAERLIDEAST